MIKSEKRAQCNRTSVKNTELGALHFDLEETLEFHGEKKDIETKDNYNSDNNSDTDLHLVFSQIAQDGRCNERKKQQGNAD